MGGCISIFLSTSSFFREGGGHEVRVPSMEKQRSLRCCCEYGNELSRSINAGSFYTKWVATNFSRNNLIYGINWLVS
jgi:hypothetical protein